MLTLAIWSWTNILIYLIKKMGINIIPEKTGRLRTAVYITFPILYILGEFYPMTKIKLTKFVKNLPDRLAIRLINTLDYLSGRY